MKAIRIPLSIPLGSRDREVHVLQAELATGRAVAVLTGGVQCPKDDPELQVSVRQLLDTMNRKGCWFGRGREIQGCSHRGVYPGVVQRQRDAFVWPADQRPRVHVLHHTPRH